MLEQASTVIPLPLSVVESNIWDVTSWPAFLGDVDWVQRTSHERYLFGIRQGRRVYEVRTAVRWHARDHRVVWRELTGPAWRGEIRLIPVNGRRTRVELQVAVHPRTFLASLADMVGGGQRALDLDLVRLAERLSVIPQPFNPSRLTPVRRIGERTAVVVPAPAPTPAPAPAPALSPALAPAPAPAPAPALARAPGPEPARAGGQDVALA